MVGRWKGMVGRDAVVGRKEVVGRDASGGGTEGSSG